MANVVRVHAFGGPEVLRLENCEIGGPGLGEVRMRVGAIGLNRVEALYRSGNSMPARFPSKIGYEAADVIEELVPGVAGWSPGDRATVLFGLPREQYGTYGETILYPADMMVHVPGALSLTKAAASWMHYANAYALVAVAEATEGDNLVITAAFSSAGLAAIQVARNNGAVPIAVTRGRDKAEALVRFGAEHVIASNKDDVGERIRSFTRGAGARILFDAVAGPPLESLLSTLATEGIAIVYGLLAGTKKGLTLPALIHGNLTMRSFYADVLVKRADARARVAAYIELGLANGSLEPVIDRLFDLADFAEAHQYLESNVQVGKFIVQTPTFDE